MCLFEDAVEGLFEGGTGLVIGAGILLLVPGFSRPSAG